MDILVPITMKNAAKCDTQCELQNSVSHQNFERSRHRRAILSVCLFQCVFAIAQLNAIELNFSRERGRVAISEMVTGSVIR